MSKKKISTDHTKKELLIHGTSEFHFYIAHTVVSDYQNNCLLEHWHPEIEIVYLLNGSMQYTANDEVVTLYPGDCMFINSRILHSTPPPETDDVHFIAITMLPDFSVSNTCSKYAQPCNNTDIFPFHVFRKDCKEADEIRRILDDIVLEYLSQNPCFELKIMSLFYEFWRILFLAFEENPIVKKLNLLSFSNNGLVNDILKFIMEHYDENISLQDISKTCHVSKGELCRIFKQEMKQTIFDYLLQYRVEQSMKLLENTNDSIASISAKCGFSNTSYYAEVFRRYVRKSPTAYRKSKKVTSVKTD